MIFVCRNMAVKWLHRSLEKREFVAPWITRCASVLSSTSVGLLARSRMAGMDLCVPSGNAASTWVQEAEKRSQLLGLTKTLDLLKVDTKPPKNGFPLTVGEFFAKFIESEMNHIVVVNFLRGNMVTEFKPDAV
jgi:hypothetical protein